MSHSQCSTFSLASACISQGTKGLFIQSPMHSFMEPLSYSRGCHYIRSLVCSHAIVCFFIITPTPTPLLSVQVLPSDCTVLYYMLYAQPFFFLSPVCTSVNASLLSSKTVSLPKAHTSQRTHISSTGTRVRGFKPGRSRWIFRAFEKSSVCLPSGGK
jgi:hypothetical protein